MPLDDAPTKKHPDRKRLTFYNLAGRRRALVRRDERKAHVELVTNAGPKSLDDLRLVHVPVVIDWWISKQRDRGVTRASLYWQRNVLDAWLGRRFPSRPFSSLTIADFTAIQDEMVMPPRSYSAGTIFTDSHLFSQMVGDAMRRGLIHWNPAAIALGGVDKPRRLELRPYYPTEDELAAIRSAAYPLALAAIDCMAEAGAKPAEILRIRPEDCNFRARTLLLRGATTDYDPDGETLARPVPMSDRLAASLLRLQFLRPPEASGTHVFGSDNGAPRRLSDFQQRLRNVQARAGVVRGEGEASGRTGRKPRRQVLGKPAVPFAKYDAAAFRHFAAVTWARDLNPKELAERLGMTAESAERIYGYVYYKERSLAWVMANPVGY